MMRRFAANAMASYEALEYRAMRALTWCAFEGTEVQDVMIGLYSIWNFHGIAEDNAEMETIIGLMEKRAMWHAEEILEGEWTDEREKHAVLESLRHLRRTGSLHPDIARFV